MAPIRTIRQRCFIILRSAQGVSQRPIAAEVGCSQSQVSYIVRKWVREQTIKVGRQAGNERQTTEEEDQNIVGAAIFYPTNTLNELLNKIRQELNLQLNISISTLSRRLIGKPGFLGFHVMDAFHINLI